jgi:hypothetical protein
LYTPRSLNPSRSLDTSFRDVAEHVEGDRTVDAQTAPADMPPRRRVRLPTSERSRTVWIVAGLLSVLALPLMVALGVLAQRTWYPTLDLAMTELRVRDVGSGNPPLIGLVGRIGSLGRQGSHPGPLSFWALWPFYRVFGASSWAMEVATVVLHLLAMFTALWIAFRRGGIRLVLAVAAVLAVLLHAYGPSTLTQPWNPYLPLMWFMVFLLAVWSVVADDLRMLPVAVFAGSYCAQTHVPYLGLTVGLGGFAIAFAVWSAYRRRRERGAMRRLASWLAIAASVAVVVWTPPVLDQIFHTPGNLSVLADYFRNPPEPPVGLRRAVDVFLVHLNPWKLARPLVTADQTRVASQIPHSSGGVVAREGSGSLVPGLLFLGTWAASVVAAWRLRHRALLRLDLVLAVVLALAVVSMSRIFGLVFYYLVLWAWGITALMALAVGWTVVEVVGGRLDRASGAKATAAGSVTMVGIVVLFSGLFTFEAASVEFPAPRLSKMLSVLVPPTADALEQHSVPGGGRDGRYLVTFRDPVDFGATSYGLVNELDRRGFPIGVLEALGPSATRFRVMDPASATGVVHLAIGPDDIATWQAKPGVREVARTEPRTPKERAEYARLRGQVIDEVNAAGLSDLVRTVDDNLFGLSMSNRVREPTRLKLVRMTNLGLPAAVFIGPREAVG